MYMSINELQLDTERLILESGIYFYVFFFPRFWMFNGKAVIRSQTKVKYSFKKKKKAAEGHLWLI